MRLITMIEKMTLMLSQDEPNGKYVMIYWDNGTYLESKVTDEIWNALQLVQDELELIE